MTNINLLPWRKLNRAREQKLLIIVVLTCLFLSVLIIFVTYSITTHLMHVQIARNSILQKEVKNIEEQIKEIKSLKHMRDTLISKMVAIQSVLMSQVFVVHLFDELIKIMPIGVYLTKMEKQSNSISLWGWAQSYTHISLLMVKIEHNSWMQSPVLNEIKKLSDKKQQYSNAFKVSFVLKPKNQAEF